MGRLWQEYAYGMRKVCQLRCKGVVWGGLYRISTGLTQDYDRITAEIHALDSVDLHEMSLRPPLHLREILLGCRRVLVTTNDEKKASEKFHNPS